MTYSTPLYGIPVPDGTSLAKNLPAELKAMGEGFEAALNAHVAIPVSNAAVVTATSSVARDSYWGTPTTETARLTLQARGATTIRTDKNITERFFATYNPTTNPQGMTPAGWYPIGTPSSLIPTTRSAAERDALFGTPSTSATQIELQNQGARTYRIDLGVTEQYFATYNATTNPGGLDTPGWTANTRQVGSRPIQPTSAVIATGTGSANAKGVVSFTGASAVSLNGVFPQTFKTYKILIRYIPGSGNVNVFFRFRSAGVDYSAGGYSYTGSQSTSTGLANVYSPGATAATITIGYGTVSSLVSIEVLNPNVAQQTNFTYSSNGHNGGGNGSLHVAGVVNSTNQYDGLTIYTSASTISGEIEVIGYND